MNSSKEVLTKAYSKDFRSKLFASCDSVKGARHSSLPQEISSGPETVGPKKAMTRARGQGRSRIAS